MGRFLLNPNDDFDTEAAFYHLRQSADLGIKEALSSLAKIYLQIPRDLLSSYSVEVISNTFRFLFSFYDYKNKLNVIFDF